MRAKLAVAACGRARYWEATMRETARERATRVVFLALSLDARGAPIPVVNTDPATDLFLRNHAVARCERSRNSGEVLQEVEPFVRDYPVGLFVDALGPVVANDAYASPEVWRMFEKDLYHSPRVVWGREVNLFLLGTADQIAAAPIHRPRGRSVARAERPIAASVARARALGRDRLAPPAQRGLELSHQQRTIVAHSLRHELGRAALEHDGSGGAVRTLPPWIREHRTDSLRYISNCVARKSQFTFVRLEAVTEHVRQSAPNSKAAALISPSAARCCCIE